MTESPLCTVDASARSTLFVEMVTKLTVTADPLTTTENADVDAVVADKFSSYVMVN